MKIVLSAFSCGPGRGSEPGMGWNWVEQISRRHEVWLLTTDEFRADITREAGPAVHPMFLPSFTRWQRLHRLPIPGLDWLYYYWWQWSAYRFARRIHSDVHFDLAFHVTFGSWRAPSFLCLLGVPLVWGPVGGGETLPRTFWGELGWKGRIYETLREAGQWFSRRDPFVRLTMRRASVILAANDDTAALIPEQYRKKLRVMPIAGISREDSAFRTPPERTSSMRSDREFLVLFAGMLEPRKGGVLALRAFSDFARSRPGARLCMIGSGPELGRLTRVAERLGIADRVSFPGWLARARVVEWMRAADVFLLPSLRDSGGFVLLEAMLAAKPVVCLDLGGPAQIVDDECGLKVRAGDPEQAVAEMADGLRRLAASQELCRALGRAGRRRVLQEFDWEKRGPQMLCIFDGIVQTTRCA